MEKQPSIDHDDDSEQKVFDRLEATIHDPRAIRTIRRALELETATNMDLALYAIPFEETCRRAGNHLNALNKRWPYQQQRVTISGWLIDREALKEGEIKTQLVKGLQVTSRGFGYQTRIHNQQDGEGLLQLRSVLNFTREDGTGETSTYTALPEDVYIEPAFQSIDHAMAILDEHYPDLRHAMDARLESIDPLSDIEIVRAFSDFMVPADPHDEIDAQLQETIHTYWSYTMELETDMPVYVVAAGTYYEEAYDESVDTVMKPHSEDNGFEDLVTIDRIMLHTSEEEDGLRMHMPVLQARVHGATKNDYDIMRQYPLHTIQDIISLRDMSLKHIRKQGR